MSFIASHHTTSCSCGEVPPPTPKRFLGAGAVAGAIAGAIGSSGECSVKGGMGIFLQV